MPFFNEIQNDFIQVFTDACVTVRGIDGEVIVSITIPSNDRLVDGIVIVTAGETGHYRDAAYEPVPAVITIVTDDALFRNA